MSMRVVSLLVTITFAISSGVSLNAQKPPRVDYSKFSHMTHAMKQNLKCDSCHKFPTRNWNQVRKSEAAFQDVAEFPEHASCLECHRAQFFARERPQPAICSNCHVNVTPRETARFLFPSLGDVSGSLLPKPDATREFAVYFPHDKHLDALASIKRNRHVFITVSWQKTADQKTCPICHQTYQPQGNSDEEYMTKPPKTLGDNFWLKKGTFKTVPNSHAPCFTCHNVEVGITPAPSECNACHKLPVTPIATTDFDPTLAKTIGVTDKRIQSTWQRRVSSGSFRHEGGEHTNVSCTNCHNVTTMNTTNVKTLSVPVHTCGGGEGCHITATSDDGGILNYEIDQRKKNATFVCTKCHLSYGSQKIPETHIRAIQALKKS